MGPTHECPACGRQYDPTETWRCACGHPLEFASELSITEPIDRERGVWAGGLAPVERRVSLGEGWTPLLDGLEPDTAYKLESVTPTGSFKDRGAAVTVSLADALGVERVLEDSSGNAGAAIATYAARAGIDAEIYVPADAPEGKLRAIERTGTELVRVEGSRRAVTEACQEAVERDRGWYASHAWQPAFFAGTASIAVEITDQLGNAPDAMVIPTGHGTLLLGAYRGFRALLAAGEVDSIPRLYAAQAAGAAPLVAARHGAAAARGDNEAADGIQVREPARGEQILAAVEETGGDTLAVGAETTRRHLEGLHHNGLTVEPTCAVGPAALAALRERGAVESGESVVVPLTGRAK